MSAKSTRNRPIHSRFSAAPARAAKAPTAGTDDYDFSIQDARRSARRIAMQSLREQDRQQSGW